MPELKKTPLYNEHLKLGAKIVEFGGWLMPVQYTNVIEEHTATRTKAGLFDICHMGEFRITGRDSIKFLQKVVTNDVSKLEDGKAFYNAMCNEKGGVIDDLFIYRMNEEEFMMVVNASTIEKDFSWLLKHKEFFDDVDMADISDETGKIDIQVPKAEEILQKLTEFDLGSLERFHFVEDKAGNITAIISRTGYTGEDGFELYFPSGNAVELWNKLLEAGKEFGLKPVGLGARDTLRIEACYSLYGHELSEEITPLEAGIGFAVKLDKGDFIGRMALEKQKNSLKRKIAAFELMDKGIAREHYDVFKDNSKIGFVTSGTFSPTFKKSIGMAMLDAGSAAVGNEIAISIREKLYKAKVVERPFYSYKGKNKKGG